MTGMMGHLELQDHRGVMELMERMVHRVYLVPRGFLEKLVNEAKKDPAVRKVKPVFKDPLENKVMADPREILDPPDLLDQLVLVETWDLPDRQGRKDQQDPKDQ